jgi:hypothetical protein
MVQFNSLRLHSSPDLFKFRFNTSKGLVGNTNDQVSVVIAAAAFKEKAQRNVVSFQKIKKRSGSARASWNPQKAKLNQIAPDLERKDF